MLVAVDAALPDTTSLPGMTIWLRLRLPVLAQRHVRGNLRLNVEVILISVVALDVVVAELESSLPKLCELGATATQFEILEHVWSIC